MTSPPATIQPTATLQPTATTQTAGTHRPAETTQPSRRAVSALVTAGLLLLLAGALVFLVVLMQPFADASGGCGGG